MSARPLKNQKAIAASKRRFRDFYPDGFYDADYVALERQYKWDAHQRWAKSLDRTTLGFARWRETLADLPRRQTRVLTWPVVTSFGFLTRPKVHMMLKPMVTRRAAAAYGYEVVYRTNPGWPTYESLLGFVRVPRSDLATWRPRDMIDLQSFIWVLGSSEYDSL